MIRKVHSSRVRFWGILIREFTESGKKLKFGTNLLISRSHIFVNEKGLVLLLKLVSPINNHILFIIIKLILYRD